MGHDTKFTKEIGNGDALLVNVNIGGQQEMRVVNMRLSDTSLNLSSGFSTSISTPSSYFFIPKPRNARQEQRNIARAQAEEAQQRQVHAFDVYASGSGGSGSGNGGDKLVYREKTETGSYRIKTQELDGAAERTRQDLLELRAKKTSDKYC